MDDTPVIAKCILHNKVSVCLSNYFKTISAVINTLAPKLTRREKIEFEVTHILIKKMLHVSSKQNGARFSIILSYFTRFDINFLKNAWEFNPEVTRKRELKGEVSNSAQNVTVLWVVF